jgi:hypothetical protein
VLPDVPWNTTDGTSYRELGACAAALLTLLESAIADRGLRGRVPVTLLAVRMGEMSDALRDLASSELAVTALIELGRAIERGRRPKRRPGRHLRHLRLL